MLSCFLYTFGKADSAGGADEAAKMASDTFGAEDARLAVRIKTDCLVAAVHTRDIASPATDTLLAVNHRINHRLAVEVRGQNDIRQFLAYKFFQLRNAAGSHVMLQPQGQIINDPVAVLHHGGADLHVSATELDEL